jgi:hypothetical protein
MQAVLAQRHGAAALGGPQKILQFVSSQEGMMGMPRQQSIQEARHRGAGPRYLRPALILAAMVAALTMSIAGPAAAAEPPTVSNVEPRHGPPAGGTSVTITGTNFAGSTAVKFGPTNATSFSVNSESSITAVSPPFTGGNAIAEVTVTTPVGTSKLRIGDSFIYEPTLTAVSPSSGPEGGGTSVTITGTAFEGKFENGGGEMPPFVSSVNFGSNTATSFKVNSETSITAVAPPGTGSVDVTVRTLGGTSPTSSADVFSYVPPPTVMKVEPNHGSPSGGTTVAISGTGFTGATAVKFGATAAKSFTVNSATSITAVSPKGKGTVDVTVTTSGGTSATSSADQVTYSKK